MTKTVQVKKDCRICRHSQFDLDFTLLCIWKGGVVKKEEAEECQGFDVLDSLKP